MSEQTNEKGAGMSPEQLAEAAGAAWSNNDKAGFLSLFTKDAKVYHPMFPDPVSPEAIVDVLDKGAGYKLAHAEREGDGIFMVFDQAAGKGQKSEVGAIPILGKIKNHKFSEFRVGPWAVRGKGEPLHKDTIKKSQEILKKGVGKQ